MNVQAPTCREMNEWSELGKDQSERESGRGELGKKAEGLSSTPVFNTNRAQQNVVCYSKQDCREIPVPLTTLDFLQWSSITPGLEF